MMLKTAERISHNAPPRIVFLSKGEDSASTRYRALQFFPSWRTAGYVVSHVTVSGGIQSWASAVRQIRLADCVVILRKTFPRPLLLLLRRLARRLVFDFDDAIFCNTDGSHSPTRMARFIAMVSACDHVFAGNRFLADQALSYNRNVSIVPTSLDLGRYASPIARPDAFIDLVWIGSRSTRKYLLDILPGIRQAAERLPDLRLKIIADFDLPDCGVPVLAIPWTEATEVGALSSAHIGIAPMRSDDWSRGKCALKVLQYMAAGLPVVSSRAGANAEVLSEAHSGFLVDTQDEWAQRIGVLAGNPELRERMGQAGRQDVAASFSIDHAFAQMHTSISGLLSLAHSS